MPLSGELQLKTSGHHDFGDRRVFEIRQPHARLVVAQARQEEIPQSLSFRALLDRVDNGKWENAGMRLGLPLRITRRDIVVDEALNDAAKLLRLLGILEIHRRFPDRLS